MCQYHSGNPKRYVSNIDPCSFVFETEITDLSTNEELSYNRFAKWKKKKLLYQHNGKHSYTRYVRSPTLLVDNWVVRVFVQFILKHHHL